MPFAESPSPLTSIAPAVTVETPGTVSVVAAVVVVALVAGTSMGLALSTPENAVIVAAHLSRADSVQV